MSRRNQLIALGSLLVVLGIVMYSQFRPEASSANAPSADEQFAPVNVDNPALRMDILKRFLDLQYRGTHRNIFSATAPPPPLPAPVKSPENVLPAPPTPVPSGPPPLNVDAKYFGYASDAKGNHRRAFFATSNNEEVVIAGEGDTVLGRFRVVRLTSTSADLEEIASGRRATMTIEEPGPNG
jgi:hypothetical protein